MQSKRPKISHSYLQTPRLRKSNFPAALLNPKLTCSLSLVEKWDVDVRLTRGKDKRHFFRALCSWSCVACRVLLWNKFAKRGVYIIVFSSVCMSQQLALRAEKVMQAKPSIVFEALDFSALALRARRAILLILHLSFCAWLCGKRCQPHLCFSGT